MFVIILWFIFGIFVNLGNGAMIHASEHSEVPANISLTSDSSRVGPDFKLTLRIWASNRLCPREETVQHSFSISTSQSTCKFIFDRTPQLSRLSSLILGNIKSQKYEFGANDTQFDDEILFNLTISNADGSVQVFGHSTDLRCYAGMFQNKSKVSIMATESQRCRFGVLLPGMETGVNFDLPDPNILHNYYIDTYTLIAIFSVLCAFILALDLAHTIYFCFT